MDKRSVNTPEPHPVAASPTAPDRSGARPTDVDRSGVGGAGMGMGGPSPAMGIRTEAMGMNAGGYGQPPSSHTDVLQPGSGPTATRAGLSRVDFQAGNIASTTTLPAPGPAPVPD